MKEELLAANQRLLDCIAAGDWETYTEICDAELTCFEPETIGHLVVGLPFHKFYFNNSNGNGKSARQETMVEPRVDFITDDVALICYVRLIQRQDVDGRDITDRFSETRVWKKVDGQWKHVHFHRSKDV